MNDVSWLGALPALLAAVLVLFGPGLLVGWAARLRGLALIAVAPALSVGVIGGAAIVLPLVGLRFNPVTTLGVLAVVTGLVWLLGWSLTRGRAWDQGKLDQGLIKPTMIGVGLAATLATIQLVGTVRKPSAFSQTFDNIFHLNAIRWILDTGQGSAFTLTQFTSTVAPPEIYPAGWHDTVALIMMTAFTDTIPVGQNALAWAAMALAWPLGCLFLIHTLWRMTPLGTVGAGVLSLAFPGFPLLLIKFGVLYPNFLGLCLLPAVFALLVQAMNFGTGIRGDARISWLVLVGSLPGLSLAHPNVTMTLLAISVTMVIAPSIRVGWLWLRRYRRPIKRDWLNFGGAMIYCLIAAKLWMVVRPVESAMIWEPISSIPQATLQWLGNCAGAPYPVVIASILALLGLAFAWRIRRAQWFVLTWSMIGFLWMLAAIQHRGFMRRTVLGVYYTDPFRLAALVPLVAVPLAALAFDRIAPWLLDKARSDRAKRSAPLAMVVVLVLGALGPSMFLAIREAHQHYVVNDESPLLTTDELSVLKQVPELVPETEAIATNPWNGSALAYALTGRKTTTTHVLYVPDERQETINEELDDAVVDPDVCPVLDELNVRWVLDFGHQEIHYQDHPMPGFDDLWTAPGFTEVYRSGEAVLYHVDACR